MEPDRRDESAMEVLESGRPPGALERWAGALLRRRWARTGVAVALVLLLTGLWVAFSPDDGGPSVSASAEAEESAVTSGSPGLRPAPAAGRQGGSPTWKVARDVTVHNSSRGHTVTFSAVNSGSAPQDPRRLQVVATFVGRTDLTYQSTCGGVKLTPRGYQPLVGTVAVGDRVFMRCRDSTPYHGRPVPLDPKSVTVRTTPCHEGERSPAF